MPQKHAKNNCASKCFNHWERNEASSEGHYGTRKARRELVERDRASDCTHCTGLGGSGGGGYYAKDGRQREAIRLSVCCCCIFEPLCACRRFSFVPVIDKRHRVPKPKGLLVLLYHYPVPWTL